MKKLLALLLLLTLLLSGCARPETPAKTAEGILYVHFISVGQADCTLLTYGEYAILIDGGNTDDGSLVEKYLKDQGVTVIDLVIATHPHEDHIGGLNRVLRKFPVKEVWTNTTFYDSFAYDNLFARIEEKNLQLHHPQVNEVRQFGDLQLTVLGPVKEDYEDVNNTSIVVMVRFGEKRFLFTGDMEALAEYDVINSGAYLKADVLKVGHHGSYSSTCAAFVKVVDPDYAVIHVGRNNDYGHPHKAPLLRLENSGAAIYRTDLLGSIVFASNGSSICVFGDNSVAPAA